MAKKFDFWTILSDYRQNRRKSDSGLGKSDRERPFFADFGENRRFAVARLFRRFWRKSSKKAPESWRARLAPSSLVSFHRISLISLIVFLLFLLFYLYLLFFYILWISMEPAFCRFRLFDFFSIFRKKVKKSRLFSKKSRRGSAFWLFVFFRLFLGKKFCAQLTCIKAFSNFLEKN